jgi:hypothetical protein
LAGERLVGVLPGQLLGCSTRAQAARGFSTSAQATRGFSARAHVTRRAESPRDHTADGI